MEGEKMVVVANTAYRTYTYSFYLNQDKGIKLVAEIRTCELFEIHNSGRCF
jgi:hypothetical protein